MYIATTAARIRSGRLLSESWKTFAVPWNPPWIELGGASSAIALVIAVSASESAMPGARLKEIVDATN